MSATDTIEKIPISILDLAIVHEGGNAASAIDNTVQVAQHAEQQGYRRIWLAEHHNMMHIASSATAVLIGHIASHTESIRVGSGGIMLPNHSPLVIAEQFGTLETLFPKRIDLGLGRAPGTDQQTAYALRRKNMTTDSQFPEDVRLLQTYLSENNSSAPVRAFPGEGSDIPLWILGSSTDSAHVAAAYGLPYAFAAHFAPAQLHQAIAIYQNEFKPSAQLAQSWMMPAVNLIAAETDEEAEWLATSLYHMFLGMVTNNRKALQPPSELPAIFQHPEVQRAVNNFTACTFIGSKESLKSNLSKFIEMTGANEIMIHSPIFSMDAKLKSLSIAAAAMEEISADICRAK